MPTTWNSGPERATALAADDTAVDEQRRWVLTTVILLLGAGLATAAAKRARSR